MSRVPTFRPRQLIVFSTFNLADMPEYVQNMTVSNKWPMSCLFSVMSDNACNNQWGRCGDLTIIKTQFDYEMGLECGTSSMFAFCRTRFPSSHISGISQPVVKTTTFEYPISSIVNVIKQTFYYVICFATFRFVLPQQISAFMNIL